MDEQTDDMKANLDMFGQVVTDFVTDRRIVKFGCRRSMPFSKSFRIISYYVHKTEERIMLEMHPCGRVGALQATNLYRFKDAANLLVKH